MGLNLHRKVLIAPAAILDPGAVRIYGSKDIVSQFFYSARLNRYNDLKWFK